MSARTLADLAIAIGRPVFPCTDNKTPITENGWKDASDNPETIRRLFARPGAALIGVPTGAFGGFVALDIDRKDAAKDGFAWLDAHRSAIPATRTHQTRSGGLHFLFRQPAGVQIASSQSKIAPGVDTRGHGGYVIVPPSAGYRVVHKAPLAEMPDWLVEATRKREAPPPPPPRTPWNTDSAAMDREAKRLAALLRVVEQAQVGQRHSRMFWSACRIGEAEARGELPGDVAFAALRDAAERVGLPQREVENAIRDARAHAAGGRAAA